MAAAPEPSREAPLPFTIRTRTFDELPAEVKLEFLEKQARETRIAAARIEQYGHVRAPIIVDHQGYKVAAIGNKLLWAKHWKTFHDLLYTNIAHVIGVEWGRAELAKPDGDRHPVIQWYRDARAYQRKRTAETGASPYELVATGPAIAYLLLAVAVFDSELVSHFENFREHPTFSGSPGGSTVVVRKPSGRWPRERSSSPSRLNSRLQA